MKNYLNEILYIVLLGMTFTFFIFMDDAKATPAAKTKAATGSIETGQSDGVPLNDYTYSPLRYVNGYN